LPQAPIVTEGDTNVALGVTEVIGNITDANNDLNITTSTFTTVSGGIATLDSNGNISYNSGSAPIGLDTIHVIAKDNLGHTTTQDINITVIAKSDTPALTMTIGNGLVLANNTYQYTVTLTPTLSDPNETLSNLVLKDIPAGVTRVEDSANNILSLNSDGTYSISANPTSGTAVTVYLYSNSTGLDTSGIHAGVTSNEATGDISGIIVSTAGTAQIIDGIIEGLRYSTTSGLEGTTDKDGNFAYNNGDVVTFSIGNIDIGNIDTNAIVDGKVFLQDIALVDRTDVNDEYVENMAVLLQSIDSNNGDNIVITEATHKAFSDDNFDLATMSEAELIAVLKDNSINAVSEDNAMSHVKNMLEAYAGIDESKFDLRVEDNGIDFSALMSAKNEMDLSKAQNNLSVLSLADVISMTDNNNDLTILGDNSDSLVLKSTDGWIKGSTVSENGQHFDIYTNNNDSTVEIKVEEEIINTII